MTFSWQIHLDTLVVLTLAFCSLVILNLHQVYECRSDDYTVVRVFGFPLPFEHEFQQPKEVGESIPAMRPRAFDGTFSPLCLLFDLAFACLFLGIAYFAFENVGEVKGRKRVMMFSLRVLMFLSTVGLVIAVYFVKAQ